MIRENMAEVEKRIEEACKKAGRAREEVTLIAVSKTKPVSDVREAMETGIVDFGENKVQEIMDKYEAIPEKLNWHMIGHLQRNKVKYIVDKVCLIHSVDSLRLAVQIDEEAKKKGRVCPILIEVNVAGEDTKFGVSVEATEALICEIAQLPNVKVKGLMTVAPFADDAEENRIHFKALRNLLVDIKRKNVDNVDMDVLSMGMTGDYEVAIEEGATMVRVGTGIFGKRNYNL